MSGLTADLAEARWGAERAVPSVRTLDTLLAQVEPRPRGRARQDLAARGPTKSHAQRIQEKTMALSKRARPAPRTGDWRRAASGCLCRGQR